MNARDGGSARSRIPQEAGVTAVELTVALVIMSAVTLAIIPVVGDLLAVSRSKGATEQVAAAMRLGRQYAIANRATYAVTMTSSTVRVTCNANCPASAPVEPTQPIPDGATITSAVNPVLFQSTGAAVAAAQVVVSTSGVADQRVCVSVPGRIVMTAPAGVCP